MFPQKLLWASVAVAMLGGGPLLPAEDSADVHLAPAQSSRAAQRAGAPIPQSADSPTQRDLLRRYADWYKRRFLPPLQLAAKGQPWESDALKLANDSFAVWVGIEQERSTKSWVELADRGDALIKSGCDELTIRYLTAHARSTDIRNRDVKTKEYRQILDQLEKDARYPRALALTVAVNLRDTLPTGGEKMDPEIVNLERQSIDEGSYDGEDGVFFVQNLLFSSNLLARNSDAMEKVVTGAQKLSEWARETILGRIERDRAWQARGNGWASTVTEEGWKGFNSSLAKARTYLEAAWKLRPDQPYAAAEMITVVMGSEAEPSDALRLWFDRAVKARFDYEKAYELYNIAILPRWGGSHEEMFAFGRACAATKRYDTNVPNRLIRAVDDIGKELSKRREIYQLPSVAAEVMAVDKGYLAAPAPPEYAEIRLNNLALDSWLCRQWADGKAAFERLPGHKLGPVMNDRLNFFGVGRNNVLVETMIYSGPAAEEYRQARELYKQGRFEEAVGHYAAVIKLCGDQPEALKLLALFTRTNNTRMEMAKGEWKDISPKIAEPDQWLLPPLSTIPEDGVLQVLGRGETTLSRWRIPVGENYEVRATFEFLTPMEQQHLFAIMLGESPQTPQESVICQFYSDRKSTGRVYVLHWFNNTTNPVFEVNLGMKNRLLVQCWQGRLNVYLNGKTVFEKLRAAEGKPGDPLGEIGFGGYRLSATEGFRVSKIAVRVLKAEPPPPEDGDDL